MGGYDYSPEEINVAIEHVMEVKQESDGSFEFLQAAGQASGFRALVAAVLDTAQHHGVRGAIEIAVGLILVGVELERRKAVQLQKVA